MNAKVVVSRLPFIKLTDIYWIFLYSKLHAIRCARLNKRKCLLCLCEKEPRKNRYPRSGSETGWKPEVAFSTAEVRLLYLSMQNLNWSLSQEGDCGRRRHWRGS